MTPDSRNPENRFLHRVARMVWLRFPPLAVYALIFYLSSKPASDFPQNIPDLIPHFLEFFLLAFLFLRMFDKPVSRRLAMASFSILLALALLDEFHQLFVATRVFSTLDLIYDLLGIVAGMLVFIRLKHEPDSDHQ